MYDDDDAQPTPSASTESTPIQGQTPPTTTVNDHLSFPSASTSEAAPTQSTAVQPRQLLKNRLYVGNLHPTVDEYTLLQVFSKYGKISKLDFLFHKTGPMKGKPRGYAFVEYSDTTDANRALTSANDKLLRGRKLVVTHAHQAPVDESYGGSGGRFRKGYTDPGKPTTLSLLKSSSGGRSHATEDKIAKMESKLRQMGQSDSFSSRPSSLPARPIMTDTQRSGAPSSNGPQNRGKGKGRAGPALPSLPLPIQPPTTTRQESTPHFPLIPPAPTSTKTSATSRKQSALSGVKIVKHRDK